MMLEIADLNGDGILNHQDLALLDLLIEHQNPEYDPVATDDHAHTRPGQAVSIPVLSNDWSPFGSPLEIIDFFQPEYGTVSFDPVSPSDTLRYEPDAGFTGTDRFAYYIADSNDTIAVGYVTVRVGSADERQDRPSPPSNLTVLEVTQTSVQLSWSPSPSSSVNAYVVSKSTDGSRWERCGKVRASRHRIEIEGLSPGTEYQFRVRAENANGLSAPSPTVTVQTRQRARLRMPELVSPADGRTGARRAPTFEWNNLVNAESYVLMLYRDTPNSKPVREYTVPKAAGDTTSFTIPEDAKLRGSRDFWWDVRGVNSEGDWGPASTKWKFTTREAPVENAPTLLSPANGRIDARRTPTFSWTNLGNADSYLLLLYRDTPDSEPVREYTIPKAAGNTSSFTIPEGSELRGAREFWWDVRGLKNDNPGPASEKWKFTTRETPLQNAPTLLNPADGRTGARRAPTFEWTNLANADSYLLLLYRDTPNSTPVRQYTVPKASGDITSFAIPEDTKLRGLRDYWWDVRGLKNDNPGPASEKWKFTTREAPVENAPTLMAPADGRTDVRLTPRFEWTNLGNADSYLLLLYRDTPDSEPSRQFTVPKAAGDTTSFTIPEGSELRGAREFWWHVRGVNSEGQGPASEKWKFTTQEAPVQNAPTLLSPTDGRTGARRAPTFEWTNLANANSYLLLLYRDTPNSTPVRDYTVPKAAGDTTSFTIPEGAELRGLRDYWWEVYGVNSQGPGPASTKWKFTTREAPVETAPTLVSPVNGRVDVRRTPTFEWTNIGAADSYVLMLYRDTPNSTPVREYTIAKTPGDTTSFTIPQGADLRSLRDYWWDVRGVNGRGAGPASAKWKFTTREAPVDSAPTLVSPVHNRSDVRRTPTFEWTNLGLASSYVLRLYRDTPNSAPVREYTISKAAGNTTSFTIPQGSELRGLRDYWWDVRGVNSQGAGPASGKWKFTTREAPVENAPTLVAPAHGRVDVRRTPTFEWTNVANANSYVLVLYRDTPNSAPARQYTIPRGAGNNTTFTIPQGAELRGLRDYWWEVHGVNSQGTGPASTKWKFTTREAPVANAPTLLAPANGRTAVRRTPTFEWTNLGNASSYILRLYRDSPNSAPVRQYTIPKAAGDTTIFTIPPGADLRALRDYWWDVSGVNSQGAGPASTKWKFTTRS